MFKGHTLCMENYCMQSEVLQHKSMELKRSEGGNYILLLL
jgi:hypothetical protein